MRSTHRDGLIAILILINVVTAATIGTIAWQRETLPIKYARTVSVTTKQDVQDKAFVTHILIDSVAAQAKTMQVLTRNMLADQVLMSRYLLSDSLVIERQDAQIQNDVIVGVTDRKPASIDELQRGVRGIAVVNFNDAGLIEARYILIGDPFPRP